MRTRAQANSIQGAKIAGVVGANDKRHESSRSKSRRATNASPASALLRSNGRVSRHDPKYQRRPQTSAGARYPPPRCGKGVDSQDSTEAEFHASRPGRMPVPASRGRGGFADLL